MVINFYQQQKHARRQAGIMVVLFLLFSVLLAILITQAVSWSVAFLLRLGNPYFDKIPPFLFTTIAILFLLPIFFASIYKLKQLSKGYYSISALGGILLSKIDSFRAKQLQNVIEEMAISANIPVPRIYILEKEPSVNAFSIGLKSVDMSICVTKGCLEQLNRDELQGVAAYEMAQIINGYTRLNTLIYGVLFGLEFIYLTMGKIFKTIYDAWGGDDDLRNPYLINDDEGGEAFGLIFLAIFLSPFWFPLWLVSYSGHFVAKIIKSIICRENVFQIDATAVQLNRNPNGLASVLQKSLQTEYSYLLCADSFLLNLEHLLFVFGSNPKYEFAILRTHPECERRIQKILPNWRGELPETQDDMPKNDKNPNNATAYSSLGATLGFMANLSNNAVIRTEIKDETYWLLAARQPEQAAAVIVAMLARHSQNQRACLDIAQMFDIKLYNNIKHLLEHDLPDERRFAILVIALSNVRLNLTNEEKMKQYKQLLQNIIQADEQVTLFECCVSAAVSGSLNMFSMPLPPVRKDKYINEINVLFSLTATHFNHGRHASIAYNNACHLCNITPAGYRDNIPLEYLSQLLQTLNRLSIEDKQRILAALKNIANADGNISCHEQDWLLTIILAWGMNG
ncbi:MAG: M48 family metalloprotease [Neisseriaceae bacterium]|nr:M48 family metalloprotease [Neisseriaceae bacterium]